MTIGSGKRWALDKGQNFCMMMSLVPHQSERENDLNETAEYLSPSGWCSGHACSCLYIANSLQCTLLLGPFKFNHDEPWPCLFFLLSVMCTNSTSVKLNFQGAGKAPQRHTWTEFTETERHDHVKWDVIECNQHIMFLAAMLTPALQRLAKTRANFMPYLKTSVGR